MCQYMCTTIVKLVYISVCTHCLVCMCVLITTCMVSVYLCTFLDVFNNFYSFCLLFQLRSNASTPFEEFDANSIVKNVSDASHCPKPYLNWVLNP